LDLPLRLLLLGQMSSQREKTASVEQTTCQGEPLTGLSKAHCDARWGLAEGVPQAFAAQSLVAAFLGERSDCSAWRGKSLPPALPLALLLVLARAVPLPSAEAKAALPSGLGAYSAPDGGPFPRRVHEGGPTERAPRDLGNGPKM